MTQKLDLQSAGAIYDQSLDLLAVLDADTGDRTQHWRSIGSLSEYSMDAVQLAVNRGWLLLEAPSVCLTAKGRETLRQNR